MYFLCRNASRAIGMCPQEMWEKIDKGGSWVRSMSPFDRKLLDIRMAGVSSETLELLIEGVLGILLQQYHGDWDQPCNTCGSFSGDGASANRSKELACNFHVLIPCWFGNFSLSLLARIVAFNTHGNGNKQRHALSLCQNTLQEMIILALLLTAKNNLVPMLFSLKLLLEEESLTTLMLVPQIPHLMIHQLVLQHEYSSSKIKAVLEVQSHCKVESPISGFNGSKGSSATSMAYSNSSIEGPIKAIVFSQWTSMLDLVEISLNQYCIQYRRLDGTLTLSSRDRTVKDLNTDPKVTVMLMSLKAGNLGLNMVAACHEILLDLWWNPTTEDQDVDRAHRIAQTRPVTVT